MGALGREVLGIVFRLYTLEFGCGVEGLGF